MKFINLKDLPEQAVSHNPNIKKKVMLTNGELGSITNFAQAVFPPGEIADEHLHEDMGEVFFVESGRGRIAIDGVAHELEPGSCAVVGAKETHEITNTGSGDLMITYFGVKLAT